MTSLFHKPRVIGDSSTDPDSTNVTFSQLDTAIRALSQKIVIIDKDLTVPPGSPVDGYVYIPKATATGLWAGLENQLVFTNDSGASWIDVTPIKGLKIYVNDETLPYEWNGTAFVLANRYLIGITHNGIPDDGWTFIRHKPGVPISFPVNLAGTGSNLYGDTATAETIITLKKNGSAFGTLTITADGTDATIVVGTKTDFNGTTDKLIIEYQATKDVTFGNIGGTIVGIKI